MIFNNECIKCGKPNHGKTLCEECDKKWQEWAVNNRQARVDKFFEGEEKMGDMFGRPSTGPMDTIGKCDKCGENLTAGHHCLGVGKPDLVTAAGSSIEPGYEPLAAILKEALDQCQYGKGRRCHANGKPFLEQPIITGGMECGPGGLAFQARKKILEALNCQDLDRAVEDLLGAINYTAAMIIVKRGLN